MKGCGEETERKRDTEEEEDIFIIDKSERAQTAGSTEDAQMDTQCGRRMEDDAERSQHIRLKKIHLRVCLLTLNNACLYTHTLKSMDSCVCVCV